VIGIRGSRRPGWWCPGALLLSAAGCATAPPPRPAVEPAGARVPPRLAPTVDVLLADGRDPDAVEIGGTTAGRVVLRRSPQGMRSAAGVELGGEVWLAAAANGTGLEFAGATWDGRLRVRPAARGPGLEVLERVDLEDYVAGVVAAELAVWSAEPAELEAQAIASRTYAACALATPRPFLFAGVRDQAYAGRPSGPEGARVREAVHRTRGVVLVEDGRLVDARFHAACGGGTARGGVVFPGLRFHCLAPVDCEPCRARAEAGDGEGDETWNWTLSREDLETLARELGVGERVTAFQPAAVDAAGRWLSVRVGGSRSSATVPFEELRAEFGPARLKSARVLRTWPRIGEPIEGGLFLEGRGRGHGVGLCQTGARGYARLGWSAERILAHYYPGAQLVEAAQ